MNKNSERESMRILQFLKSTCAKAIKLLPTLSFNKKNLYHQYVISLYCKMIEMAVSCHVLVEKKMASGLPILFRSYLEAYIDLKNLFKNKSYMNFMEATFLAEWVRVYRHSKKKDNPYLQGISKIKNIDKIISENERQLKHLKKKKFRPLQRREIFERADMLAEYQSMYNFLCCHAHNNKRSLRERYIKITNKDFQFIIFKDFTIQDVSFYLLTLCDYLIEISSKIHRLLGKTSQTDFDKLKVKLLELLEESARGQAKPLENDFEKIKNVTNKSSYK